MEIKTKKWLHKFFMFCSEQMSIIYLGSFLLIIFKIIELFQFFAVIFLLNYRQYPDSATAENLHSFFLTCVLQGVVKAEGVLIFARIAVLCVIIGITIIKVFLIWKMPDHATKLYSPYYMQFMFRAVSAYQTVFEYIFMVPFQLMFNDVYLCDSIDLCFGTSHSVLFGVTVLAQACFVFHVTIALFFSRDNTPFSNTPNAYYNPYSDYLRFIIKFLMALFISIANRASLHIVIVAIIAIIFLNTLILRMAQGGECQSLPRILNTLQETMVLIASVIVGLSAYVDTPEIALYVGICLSPALYPCIEFFRRYKEDTMLTTTLPANQQRIWDLEQYMWALVDIVTNPEPERNFMRLSAVYVNHKLTCDNASCVCSQLNSFMHKKYGKVTSGLEGATRSRLLVRSTINFMRKYNKVVHLWHQLVINLINDSLVRHQRDPRVHIQISNLYFYLLKNPFMALYSCHTAGTLRPPLSTLFSLFHHCRRVEKMLCDRAKTDFSRKDHSLNTLSNLEYTALLNEF